MASLIAAWSRAALALACALAGAAAQAQAQPWVVGQVAPLTGMGGTQGRAYAQGMRLHFDQLNKAGGIQGQPVQLVVVDDGGHPDNTVARTRELLARSRPVLLAGFMGNANLAALLGSGLLEQERISLVGYQGNDTQVAHAPRVFSTRAGLQDEMAKIASHLAIVGITRVAVVTEQRADSDAVLQLAQTAAMPAGAKPVAQLMLRSGRSQMAAAVDQLNKSHPAPQAILLIASSPATAAFVEAYRMESGTAQIYATSDSDIEQLATRLPPELMSGLSIAQVVPSPYRVSMRLNREFRDALAAQPRSGETPASYAMMEGYVNAKVVAEALRRAQPVTRERLGASLRNFGPHDLGGYWVAFKPGSQFGSRFVDLSIVSASGRISY
ncbi:ABC transporter substrate-binding protein [Comamonas endophytica]|uniref:ABC transporter substrate-binding protein n=1 Tax=Comamonas endophytica TaxID=2949090 RepID=A0ABY6G7N8_9BURK|nr:MULTISPECIES: ABC transporter substrate-binding protein [unclassified Acidovorax]MCD2514475.1 ABC transporter substrate-binding protein [Acidovorax sp. D4N7]UYG51056.1 ABC transporter substrate-binding protein [Acidovorax sp. 5MLIR]